ncbi:hypothetical protein MMC29_001291 [Sticta canariensis]|nr:hypothetical protein [Sticta canariensis]
MEFILLAGSNSATFNSPYSLPDSYLLLPSAAGCTALHMALDPEKGLPFQIAACMLCKALDRGGTVSRVLAQQDSRGRTPAVMLFCHSQQPPGSDFLEQLAIRLLQAEPDCLHVADASGTTPLALATEVREGS